MKNIKVSIIIPVYNVENFLRQCLDSVINQSLKEIEIICVNDGSTDNSPKILNEYAQNDSRIQIINKKNAGLGAARNTGMKYVTGEYIGFVDSDDWVDINMFEALYENGKAYKSDIIMCPINLVNEFTGKLNRDTSYFNLQCFKNEFDNRGFNQIETRDIIFNIAVNAWNKIYRIEFINDINAQFPEGLIFEDVPFFYQTYLNARIVTLIRDFLYFHRVNRADSITTKVDKRHFDIIKIQNLMIEHFSAHPTFEDYKIELLNRKISRIIVRYYEMADTLRQEFFEIIKQDFEKIKKEDIDDLSLGMYKHHKNIITSYTHREFEIKEENDKLSNKITQLTAEKNSLLKEYVNHIVSNNNLPKTGYKIEKNIEKNSFKYKFKNFFKRIKNQNHYLYTLFQTNNLGIKTGLININGYNAIKKNDYFDLEYYLKNNPDIKLSNIDPILHYIYHGYKEGRKPNPYFDGDYYLRSYNDVKQSNLNPLIHYSLYGMKEGKKTQEIFKEFRNKNNQNQNKAKKLVISYCFTPYADTSANVVAKRIMEQNQVVDVIQNNMDGIRDIDKHSHILTDDLIEDQIIINSKPLFGNWYHINDFCTKGMKKINENVMIKGEYEEIYSRTMFPASHFLAFEYKVKYPNVKWTAEFSDPLIYDVKGNIRNSKINNQEYLDNINNLLSKHGFPEYNENNLFFLCEYLPYVFADVLIFTNENQKEFMIDNFPIPEISGIIEKKAVITKHPTLKEDLYNVIECDYRLDNNYVNFAYFGRDYETRNLNDVFYALYGLTNEYKNRCKIHFFTSDVEGFEKKMGCSPIRNNLEVNSYVSFFEFLNLTTKFDCLIVNDAKKEGINPYLPSKISDYLGSGTDIWVIYEEGSAMSNVDVKYKSILGNFKSIQKTLKQILKDHS